MKEIIAVETYLSGADIIGRLRMGHMVRRACWIEGFYIRIGREGGYDKNGLAVFDDRESEIYTESTDGYFMHLGYSAQPFANMRVDEYYPGHYEEVEDDGAGIAMLWANDWEDYGFIAEEEFRALTKELRSIVEQKQKDAFVRAVEKAKADAASR